MKLHLGCGTRYFDGYVNIDFPPSHHTVQSSIRADRYEDLRTLSYPKESLEEVRLHHVFEHFPRPVAPALLCRWRDWLQVDGLLHMETPDLIGSSWLLVSPFVSFEDKQQVVRHLFGSHEAPWAVHWDGWYAERFEVTLRSLGFRDLRTQRSRWGTLRNVEVFAKRGPEIFCVDDYRKSVRELLTLSAVTLPSRSGKAREIADSEAEMVEVWMSMWEDAYLGRATHI